MHTGWLMCSVHSVLCCVSVCAEAHGKSRYIGMHIAEMARRSRWDYPRAPISLSLSLFAVLRLPAYTRAARRSSTYSSERAVASSTKREGSSRRVNFVSWPNRRFRFVVAFVSFATWSRNRSACSSGIEFVSLEILDTSHQSIDLLSRCSVSRDFESESEEADLFRIELVFSLDF